ncbi:hypothetical protein Tco_0527522 [Tanacetum coccineum]
MCKCRSRSRVGQSLQHFEYILNLELRRRCPPGAAVAAESSTGKTYWFQALRALRLEDLRFLLPKQVKSKGITCATGGYMRRNDERANLPEELGVPIVMR